MVVLVPTRELSMQVGKEIKRICTLLDLNIGIFYGGKDIMLDSQQLTMKKQIVIGTPGRLIQHINWKKIRVGDVKYLVYDESDQMFDHGFYKDCVYLRKRVSKDAQIILASATLTDQVRNFIDNEIINYELLEIGELIPKNITQEKLYCDKLEKNKILTNLLSEKRFKRALIFCNTKIKAANIAKFLQKNDINSKFLHGDLDQKDRENNLRLFKEGKVKVLVTTEVAARGLHIEDIDIIINYDVPTKVELYIHRIGRTGRRDKKGYSLTLICPEDKDRFYNIEFEYQIKVKEIKL